EPVSKVIEDRIKLPDALLYRFKPFLPPLTPRPRRQSNTRLNVVRVLRKNQSSDFLAQRNVEGAGPARRLLDRKPDQIEIVMRVLGLEASHLCHRRVPAVSAHDDIRANLERFRAVTHPAHPDDETVLLDQLRNFGSHPAFKRRKLLSLAQQRAQKHG